MTFFFMYSGSLLDNIWILLGILSQSLIAPFLDSFLRCLSLKVLFAIVTEPQPYLIYVPSHMFGPIYLQTHKGNLFQVLRHSSSDNYFLHISIRIDLLIFSFYDALKLNTGFITSIISTDSLTTSMISSNDL